MAHAPIVSGTARALSLAVVACCAAHAAAAFAQAPAPSFSDIQASDTYYAAVTSLASQGIIRGYPDGTFRPRGQITRAEMLALLYRGIDPAEVARRATLAPRAFPDVVSAAWYAPYVYAAAYDGVVQGYPDGTFRPTLPVDAASALKMIVEARGIPKLPDQPGDRWYVSYAQTLSQLNALPPWLLSPVEPMTRGTTAVVLYRVEQTRPDWQMVADANPSSAGQAVAWASSAGHAAAPPPVPSSRSSAATAPVPPASKKSSSAASDMTYPGQEPDEITALQYLKSVFKQLSDQLSGSSNGQ
jgi:hypothetical protein